MEGNQRLCEKLKCLWQIWWFKSAFTLTQSGQMTSLAVFCLVCLCHGRGAMPSNRKKKTDTNKTAKTICWICLYIFCVSPRWLHSSVLSHATRQVNANYYSGQEVCDRFQGVFLCLNAAPPLAPSCIGATRCTNSGQTLLTVISNSVQAEKEQPFFPHTIVKRAIKYSVS